MAVSAEPLPLRFEWAVQPKQVEFLRACGVSCGIEGGDPKPPMARVILYGGSAGGGKSDALLMLALLWAIYYPGSKIGIFRRLYTELEGAGGLIQRSHEMFNLQYDSKNKLASWHGGKRTWTFSNKSYVQFSHCKHDSDVHSYQSQMFDLLIFDESTQFTPWQIDYLGTRNRATVRCTPLIAMATNPGGASHNWHKEMFIKAGEPGKPVMVEVQPNKFETHLFIPSRLEDNQVLEERDPGYRRTLENKPENLRRALLEGDWDVFEGQYFREFNTHKHVIEPIKLEDHWRRFGSFDWGYAAPACFLWHTIDPSMGRIYTYREFYVSQMRAGEVAQKVLELTGGEHLEYIKMGPDAFRESGLGSKATPGESVADEFLKVGLNVEPADNRRILGWQRTREYLSMAPDEKPWWQIFRTCVNLARTLPELRYDKQRIEDVAGDCEDHAPEAARYFLMSRPSPMEGASFNPGTREQFSSGSLDDEDDDWDDMMGDESISFYHI